MNPSPQAITIIRGWVTDWTQTDAALAASLNAATVANPVTQAPQVPVTLTESGLAMLLTDPSNGSATRLTNYPNLGLLKADIDAGNRAGMALWIARLEGAGIITQGEAQAIGNYCGSNVADPNWTAQIPRTTAVLGRLVDAADLTASRPAGS